MTPPLQTNRAFGLSFAIFLGAIFGIEWYFFSRINPWTGGISGLFFLLALVRPITLLLFNRLWRVLAGMLGAISNPLVLGVVFYGIMTPLGLARRWFGQDTMGRKAFADPHCSTFLTPVGRQTTPETLRDIF
ncbi:MAG: hypothetical protein HQL93_08915 [Magnetococcales bacterium]|nr:hypothetical protein [Magnetococcales bacterium]